MTRDRLISAVGAFALAFALAACDSGGSATSPLAPSPPPPVAPPPPPPPPTGGRYEAPAERALSIADVERIVAQAATEAEAQGVAGVIVVVDRVGNVLAAFEMDGATPTTTTRPGPEAAGPAPAPGNLDAQGLTIPRFTAAIAKAITGAYLSSAGNAFSTRTASMIVQEHFPPAPTTAGLESGPLFGVQFSQLPCSDFATRYAPGPARPGPHRSPLGLAGDPGGLPLYKDGVVVGGVGVSVDDDYGFDTNVLDVDQDVEELIAVAGASGFAAPQEIRADRISVDGTLLRFADVDEADLATTPASAPALASVAGGLVRVPGYFGEDVLAVRAGAAYGAESSGVRAATPAEFADPDAFVFTDGSGVNRFPASAGTDGADVAEPLTEAEVEALLEEAFGVMAQARAQIRQPLDSRAQVTISVVDTHGSILGMVRSPDAPIFGADVSLQKARTAAFFSNPAAADDLARAVRNPALAGGTAHDPNVRAFVDRVRGFLNDPAALTGAVAFSDRAGGNLSRPYFPDGQVNTANGPLSRPIDAWSPFSTGLQSALVVENLAEHLGFLVSNAASPSVPPSPADTRARCAFTPDIPGAATARNRLQNGIQIFPGSVPIYRGDALVGGIGVSGDGIDQDDMISFLGLHRAGLRLGTINNAPSAIRADQIVVDVGGTGVRLRYVNCPFSPFLESEATNVCQGL